MNKIDEFTMFAIKNYDNPSCSSVDDFYDDLKRFKYIKRLLRRYSNTGELSERLLLNHIILLHNVFNSAVVPMLFNKIEQEHWPQIKTFLVFLNYLPENYEIDGKIPISDVSLDQTIISVLRKI